MKLILDIQRAASVSEPDDNALRQWVSAALPQSPRTYELCLRVVEEAESAELNQHYRNKPGATNVLSFPCEADLPDLALLGDLVVCAPVVLREAREQRKTEAAHWAHMVVHGTLHLLGYDHIGEHDALIMESQERAILARLGFSDPYS